MASPQAPVSTPVANINTSHATADGVSASEFNSLSALSGLAYIDNSAVVANISAATLIGSAAVVTGTYLVKATATTTTAGTSGALTVNVIYTDPDTNAAYTAQICSIANIATAAPQYANGVVTLRAKVGTVIQYSVSGLTTPGALAGAIHIALRMGA